MTVVPLLHYIKYQQASLPHVTSISNITELLEQHYTTEGSEVQL